MISKPDYTTLACLERCEQEFVYRHVQHLDAAKPSAPAHFGQIVAKGVQVLYNERPLEEAQATMRAAWGQGWEATLVALGLHQELVQSCVECGGVGKGGTPWSGPKPLPTCQCSGPTETVPLLDADKPQFSLARAKAVVRAYETQWRASQWRTDPRAMFRVAWNEAYAESATESAIPDRCVRSTTDGLLYAMDLKTTSMYLSASWMQSFQHSQQAAIQLDVLEHTLEEPIAGFWLDAIGLGRTISGPDFRREGPFTYSAALRAELRKLRAALWRRAQDLIAYPEAARKNLGACVRYNALCPFFAICTKDPLDRADTIAVGLEKGIWREREWNPKRRD